ncbi:hypothetical protein ABPG77_004004 [Micractinium sp. CCAP 211/92]
MSTEGTAGAGAGPLAAPPAAAIASPAPGRHGKLPPSPASTFMRPQQLLQRQRAAERAAVEQDAAALAQLLGASMQLGPIAEASEQPLQPQASSVAMPERSNAPASGAAVENGILTGATLQALLVQQPSKRWQGQGQPGPGLGAEPSVLSSYIAGTEEDSRLLQRQMTHLQATTSGGAGASGRAAGWAAVGAPPPPLRSARSMPGRREVFVLSKWLEVETTRFNEIYARKDERTPLVDFLLLAASKAKAIYSQAYAELARQVTLHCEERGRLMADVWIGYAAMLDSVLGRVHAAYAVVKDRAERAEARLELAEGRLEQERASAEAYKTELQDELARLRAELTAALSVGGGGGHVDVMSAVLGHRGLAADAGGPLHAASGRECSLAAVGGRAGRPLGSHFSPTSTAAASKRGTLASEGLWRGSQRISGAMGGVMRHLEEQTDSSGEGVSSEEFEALQQQNCAMREALDSARQELLDVYKQLADLEAATNEAVLLESRAETAENERDEALAQLRATTPRPPLEWEDLAAVVGEPGVASFKAALEAHRLWPTDDLAMMLVGGLLHAAENGSPQAAQRPAGGSDALSRTNSGAVDSAGAAAAAAEAPVRAEGSTASVALAAQGEGGDSSAGLSAPGQVAEGGSHLTEHLQALGCLRVALSQGLLSREELKQAILSRDVALVVRAADVDEEQAEWLAGALSRPVANPDALVDFLAGATRDGHPLAPSFYGCMQQHCKGISFDVVRSAVQRARMSTKSRVAMLEEEVRALHKENGELRGTVQGYRDAEQRRDAARRRREEEAQLERKNPLQQYVELLGSQDEAAWKDSLIGMGQSAEVPKLFKHSGKLRNKHLSKRDTEKLVKEIWKERMADPAAAAGKAVDLLEFVFTQLQKKVGIVTAVVEMGYNFLFGLWKYQWDADCELFLRIILGEVKEDVYVAQVRLQAEVEELFAAIDKAKGQATGFFSKEDLRTAFLAYFKVGQPGGKTLKRFDELMQAIDEDQEGDVVEWKKVFEEDREFNQGEFAEAIRDQFLQERVEFFKALEDAIYEEAGYEEECSKEHAVRALLRVDLDMTEKAAQQTAAAIFPPGLELLSVKAVMRKLSRGVVRRGRASSTKTSVMGSAAAGIKGARGSGNALLKKAAAPSESVLRALEALRQEWIAKELQRPPSAGGGVKAG